MLGMRNLSILDHQLGLAQVASLSEKLRRDPIALIAMTFIDTAAGFAELICRNRASQIFTGPARIGTRVSAHLARSEALAKSLARPLPRLRRALVRHKRVSRQRRNIARYQSVRARMDGSFSRRGAHRTFPSRRRLFRIFADRAHACTARANLAALRREWSRPRCRLGARHDLSRIRRSRAAHQAHDQPCSRCGAADLIPYSAFGGDVSQTIANPAILNAVRD
jgi:hypothetical protein